MKEITIKLTDKEYYQYVGFTIALHESSFMKN